MELRQQSFRIHVSIQLLLLFYDYGNQYYPPWRFVSIQLLLLFYEYGKILWTDGLPFQYNFCYCSMPLIPLFIKGHLRFNTAFVIVLSAPEFAQNELLTLFQYSFCYCSIYFAEDDTPYLFEFQYNFCYCSIMQLLMTMNGITGFNTTFVTVLWSAGQDQSISCTGFNTTFVTVLYHEFTEAELTALFQYNFCYCSIYHPFLMQVANNCFNTTFVTVLLCNFQGLWMG